MVILCVRRSCADSLLKGYVERVGFEMARVAQGKKVFECWRKGQCNKDSNTNVVVKSNRVYDTNGGGTTPKKGKKKSLRKIAYFEGARPISKYARFGHAAVQSVAMSPALLPLIFDPLSCRLPPPHSSFHGASLLHRPLLI